MKTIEKTFPLPRELSFPEEIELKNCLFFDIETTGLSREHHHVYLIGVLCQKGDHFHLCQWLAQNPSQEGELIRSFFTFAKGFRTLISFNGEHFDYPFLVSRKQRLGLSVPEPDCSQLDLYLLVRKYKSLLGVENGKQKTLERFLGIFREDLYSGKELISIYESYVREPEWEKEKILLLHNEEDVLGMPRLLPLLSYSALPCASFSNIRCRKESYRQLSGEEKKELYVNASSSFQIPRPIFLKKEGWYIKMDGNALCVRIPLLFGEMKHYYPDYQNYYYLPLEDCALHKSVASYVDKNHRQKATKKTCYTKASGLFFPQPEKLLTPEFYKNSPEGICYGRYEDSLLENQQFWQSYLKQLLHLFIQS